MLLPRITRTAPNVVSVHCTVTGKGWEQWVLLRSDVHHDNPHCDWKLERKHLDESKAHGAIVIDNGDLFCAMQGKYDRRSSKTSLRPEHQTGEYLDALVRTAAEFYQPYAAHFAVLGLGNHETSITDRHETSLTERLAERLRAVGSPVLVTGYSGWVRFLCTRAKNARSSILLHHYHGSGGSAPVTKGVIQSNRIGVYTPDPHVILTGHSHTEWTVTLPRQRITQQGVVYRDEQIHVRVPGYKDAWADGRGGFEVEKLHGPKPLGAAWLRLWLEVDEVRYEVVPAK